MGGGGQALGCCEQGDEHAGSMEYKKLLDYMKRNYFRKKDAASRVSWLVS